MRRTIAGCMMMCLLGTSVYAVKDTCSVFFDNSCDSSLDCGGYVCDAGGVCDCGTLDSGDD